MKVEDQNVVLVVSSAYIFQTYLYNFKVDCICLDICSIVSD